METETAGTRSIVWNGKNFRGNPVTSGVYFYKLSSDRFTSTKEMILIK